MNTRISTASDARKWAFLRAAPAVDALAPELRHLAASLQTLAMGRAERVAALALALAQDCVRYQLDTARTGAEDVAGYTRPAESPVEILVRGVDDCDGKARLFCGLCLASGIEARMVPVWKGGSLAHVFAEVRIGGRWLAAEPTARRALLGETQQQVPREPGGEILT